MNIEKELKGKEVIYLKLLSGEDVFAMVQTEVLDSPENVNGISLHQPFVLRSMLREQMSQRPSTLEYAVRWCPYADDFYNNVIPIPSGAIMAMLKPEDDMIARYFEWLSEEQEPTHIEESEESDVFDGLDELQSRLKKIDRKLH